jgi:hypothetical protein
MSEIYHRYQRGEQIPVTDLNTSDGLRLYGEIIHFEWRADQATKQLTLDGDIIIQKVNPLEVLTPEQEHLIRPPDTREGRRQGGA